MARPICLRLLEQDMRLAASRTFCTAGKSRPMSTAMMAMTTSSSISVKALLSPRTDNRTRVMMSPPEQGDNADRECTLDAQDLIVACQGTNGEMVVATECTAV